MGRGVGDGMKGVGVGSRAVLACWIAGVLLAVPVLAVRYPPMGDLAMHEALVSILRHRGDASWAPAGLYTVVAPQANQLFAWLAYVASLVLPTDTACTLVVAATILLAPPAAARLLVRLHVSPWLGLLVGPIACGWMFRWGLVANMTGLVALLLSLPFAERLAVRPSWRALGACVLAALVTFFAHESSAIVLALAVGFFAVVRGRSALGLAMRVAPAAFVLGLVAAQWKVSAGLAGASMRAVGTYHGIGVLQRLQSLPGAVFGGIGEVRLTVVGGLWLAALVASAAGRRAARPSLPRVALWRFRYALLGVVFFFLYLTFPMGLAGTTLVAHRFLPAACVCAIAACAGRTLSRPGVALAVAVPLAMLAAELRDFGKSDKSYRALDTIIAQVPTGVAVAQLDLTPRLPGHVAPVPGAASRVLAERGGRMLFAMTDMPPNPVCVPAAMQWNEPVLRLASDPFAFAPAADLTRFAYVVVRDDNPRMRPLVAAAMAPEAERVAADGEWTLFHSRLPTVPLTAPDGLAPPQSAETLGARIERESEKRLRDASPRP